ncbi:hypothetical protein Gotur_025148 [Gossypium turneri]
MRNLQHLQSQRCADDTTSVTITRTKKR